jgi:excinuclease ABC subunit B
MNQPFELVTNFSAAGDQPLAIEQLAQGVERGEKSQVLLGVTGSGKTFTMASVVAGNDRPRLPPTKQR